MKTNMFAKVICSVLLGVSTVASAAGLDVQGGVTGGGGNTLTSGFATPAEVAQMIQNSKDQVIAVARMAGVRMQLFPEQYSDQAKALFKVKNQLEQRISGMTIQILTDRPCIDVDGNARTGAWDARKPDIICLSAGDIARFVERSEVRNQVAALILHEVSHSFGFDENAAYEFQRRIMQMVTLSNAREIPPFENKITNVPAALGRNLIYFQKVVIPQMKAYVAAAPEKKCQVMQEIYLPDTEFMMGGSWSLLGVEAGLKYDNWTSMMSLFAKRCYNNMTKSPATYADESFLISNTIAIEQDIHESLGLFSASNGFKVEIH
ncbi:hypothetical protein DOM22_17580 [Bdellovibrio sp. ZAP7]|uniref:metallopeptidase family protein n=1 Tax=Bdellovibrio sp. ZAP7 TaxID=2231053 RepID=UPI001156F461|nr:metallopeptidase family protein [Bdellovibrio sp. ZAP7]QDK46837.1 hypothetical protein DOM22_17580 [Bdellovibrio sp. ZAP7]